MKTWLVALLCLVVSVPSFAKTASPDWPAVSDEICQYMHGVLKHQAAGEHELAQLDAVSAHFKLYDVKMEPVVRAHWGDAHVYAVEGLFHQIIQQLQDLGTQRTIPVALERLQQKLCTQLRQDALALQADAGVSKS